MSGVQHVALETPREVREAEVAFWALLGFARVEPPASLRGRATWLQDTGGSGTQIHLLHDDLPTIPPGAHVAVVAPPPFEATVAALQEAGHTVQPREQHWGVPRAYVRSPGRHLVEVMAAAPPPG